MMSSIMQFLWSTDFIPHGMCLSWRTDVIVVMLVSELVIGGCYLSVAASLGVFARKRPDFPYPGIMILFSLVFALCGMSHLVQAATLWVPWYGIQAAFNACVAILALPAAWKMWKLVPEALALPSPHHLQKANDALAREVAEHQKTEVSLREAVTVAEMAGRARSAFLATMSHELRTPLNAVLGFSDALLHQIFGALNDKQRDYVQSIHASGKHLLNLISDILDISKIDAGKLELQECEVVVEDLVQSCVKLVSENAEAAGVEVSVDLPASGQTVVCADPLRLKQVLLNLLSNGIKFTPRDGAVKVSVATDASGALTVSVADTGIGMKPEDIPRAFEMFAQVENPMTRRFGGTGIGLPLTRSLVEMHGGALDLTSTPGKGTNVTFSLPWTRVVRTA
jgi:signal transduction histidine kinase